MQALFFRAIYFLIRSAFFLIAAIPTRTGYWCCDRIARWGYRIDVKRRRRAVSNISMAFPDRTPSEHEAIAKACYRNLLRIGYEMILTEKHLTPETVQACGDFAELEKAGDLLSKNKATILLGAHVGNWEIAGIIMGILGHRITAVAMGVGENPLLDLFIKRFREKYGLKIISHLGAVKNGRDILRNNENLYFTADQHVGGSGLWVDFFGRPVAWTKSPASLAHRLNVPIIVGFCRRMENRFRFKFTVFPPIIPDPQLPVREDIGRMTQIYVRYLESYIRQHPEDYLWIYRIWRRPKDGEERMMEDGVYVRHASFTGDG
ncbi:MAG: hypothetical protein KJ645_13765 [Planctomycetes bacterium]|nr:hypothetical protein [Planctomycetota bacterium]